MLLVFLTATLLGQLPLQLCLCSGEISIAPTDCCPGGHVPVDDCDHGDPCGEEEETPCHHEDCVVAVALPALDTPASLELRHGGSIGFAAPASYEIHSFETPRSLKCQPLIKRLHAPPGPPLTVLYASFLI